MLGGCYCGRIRYEAAGAPFHETACHCSICRRTTGAPYVAWFSVRSADFRFTAGEPARFSSSPHGTRTFCPTCGTQLTFKSSGAPGEIDVTTGSLDDPETVPPRDHIFIGTRLRWVRIDDGLPAHHGERPADPAEPD